MPVLNGQLRICAQQCRLQMHPRHDRGHSRLARRQLQLRQGRLRQFLHHEGSNHEFDVRREVGVGPVRSCHKRIRSQPGVLDNCEIYALRFLVLLLDFL